LLRVVFYATFTIPSSCKLEKNRFHTLLNNYTSLRDDEAQILISLEKEFPYSQVIHSLTARATQDNNLPEKEEQLHLGAIYTTDRAVFKSIMTAAPQERKSVVIIQDVPQVETEDFKKAAPKETIELNISTGSLDSSHRFTGLTSDVSFYDEIQHDLEKLKELRHEFEETVKQFENGTLSATLNSETEQKKKSKPADPTDELLTEIKTAKKKVKPEGPRQKEQIEIIEQFIKTQPTIKGKIAVEEMTIQKDDLSEKSLIYNENIISETLALILIKQGKKEKAIEVLKKLIWKFPQKKTYFAAQIEDLKK
jgi:tetratricopeptide (TPR) repeat protein